MAFPFVFKRPGGILNDTVPAGLPCSHGRDTHPSRGFLQAAVLAMRLRAISDPAFIEIKAGLMNN